MPKKPNNRDKTLKSSVEFDKVSPQSGIVRRECGVESRYHREVKGWSCGTMAKIENRQKVVRQKGSRGWRMESKARENEKIDERRRRKASGKVGWLGRVMEADQKKPMVWACARQ